MTKNGQKLYNLLAPSFKGLTPGLPELCNLLARHARTYNRIQEIWCSVELSPTATKWYEHREELIEKRIVELVRALPRVKGKPIIVRFTGDPRGYCVKLIMPDERYNTWGGAEDGIGIPCER